MSKPKAPTQDQDLAIEQHSMEGFIAHFNTFITVRLFASAYQNSSRDEYLKAVTDLVAGFSTVMKQTITAECQRMRAAKANELALARYRVQKTEVLEKITNYASQYLISLRPEEPKATNAVEVKPEVKLEKEP